MHYTTLLPGLLGLLPATEAIVNIWLAGDSTMAKGGGGTGTEGWGQYLQYSFDKTKYLVNNEAVAGRSARSYRREGRFQTIADEVVSGDVSTYRLLPHKTPYTPGGRGDYSHTCNKQADLSI